LGPDIEPKSRQRGTVSSIESKESFLELRDLSTDYSQSFDVQGPVRKEEDKGKGGEGNE
jgi:hypothetical protein